MASTDCFHFLKKPGQALGFVMLIVCLFGALVIASHVLPNAPAWMADFKVDTNNRVSFWAGYGAVLAALWSARLGVRNMVRQHTINTILQSRLSTIFIERGAKVAEGVKKFNESSEGVKKLDYVDLDDLKYLLNFYEYVAIGIKFGDLDEEVMRDTLRSVVLNLCAEFSDYIKERQSVNPRLYMNLTTLRDRWQNEADQEKNEATRKAMAGLPAHEAKRV